MVNGVGRPLLIWSGREETNRHHRPECPTPARVRGSGREPMVGGRCVTRLACWRCEHREELRGLVDREAPGDGEQVPIAGDEHGVLLRG